MTIRLRIQETQLVSAVSPEDVAVCLNSGKILLVEDNEINVEIETEILEKAGFCIEIAENGSIAVEKVKKSEPGEYALVLMDIQMRLWTEERRQRLFGDLGILSWRTSLLLLCQRMRFRK